MFVWVEGPEGVNMDDIYQAAVRRQVAFVPGHFFFAQPGDGLGTMRLNFTMPSSDEIDRAIQILGEVIRESSRRQVSHESGSAEWQQNASRAGIEVL